MAKSYKDYLNKEISRVTSTSIHANSYKNYLLYARKIKRHQMIDRICDILE